MNLDTFTLLSFCVASQCSHFGKFLADAFLTVAVVPQLESYRVDDDVKDPSPTRHGTQCFLTAISALS